MKTTQLALPLILFIFLLCPHVHAQDLSEESGTILSSAEAMFKSMQKKDYVAIWQSLSRKSQETIVQDTYKSVKPASPAHTEESVGRDFSSGGPLAIAYWNAFLNKFDPAMALEQSRWQMHTVNADNAEIIILYKKSQSPAMLKMFKEEGAWKVGLTETFWSRK